MAEQVGQPAAETAEATHALRAWQLGLSGKLLMLTVLFVMLAEVLIYVPSVANFRLNWLHDRLSAAYTAALVFEAANDGMVPETVARQILEMHGGRLWFENRIGGGTTFRFTLHVGARTAREFEAAGRV